MVKTVRFTKKISSQLQTKYVEAEILNNSFYSACINTVGINQEIE